MARQGVSKRLIEAGWRQGVIFSLAGAILPILSAENESGTGVAVSTVDIAPDDCLIVASHTCDIAADAQKEPYVEALVCKEEDDAARLATIGNSARWFRISADSNLVVWGAQRVLIKKECLVEILPEQFPGSEERRDRFSYWLARRYERPALPDEMVKGFQSPLQQRLRALAKCRSQTIELFNRTVQQIRIGVIDSPQECSPVELHVLFLLASEHGRVTADEADAIADVFSEAKDAAVDELVSVQSYEVRTEDDISLRYYLDTEPIFLDQFTYLGDEIVGAEPSRE